MTLQRGLFADFSPFFPRKNAPKRLLARERRASFHTFLAKSPTPKFVRSSTTFPARVESLRRSVLHDVHRQRCAVPTPSRIVSTNPKVPTMKTTCVCCRFFSPQSAGRSRNECRRHSPAARRAQDGRHDQFAVGIWPAVSPDGWCGEFKSRFSVPPIHGMSAVMKLPR